MSASSQLVCIKRPEPGLNAVFEDMYVNERLVDVTLSCSNGQLQAHKLVLAACSSYFSGLFNKLANPFHYPVIIIKDMQIEDLKLIVEFMYRGQLTVSQDKLMSLLKSAENLQINGLSNNDGLITSPVEGTSSNSNARLLNQRYKRAKRTNSSSSGNNQIMFNRAYQQSRSGDDPSPRPEKLLEQSMITGESLDGSGHQFGYSSNDPTSTRNLNGNNNQQQHQLLNSTLPLQLQHLSTDQHQLQVLSHSLAANRTSMTQTTSNGQANSQTSVQQSQSRGRVHPCNICWKTFREKANLKRHLQVHSLDRVMYACPDCNKTFSWKDNYIRHTKTAHHMNNVRQQN